MAETIEILGYILGITLFRYFIIAGTAFLLCYLLLSKMLENSKIQKRTLKQKNIRSEIMHSSQTALVFTAITFIVLFSPLKEHTLLYEQIDEYPYWWIGVSTLAGLIVHDTYFYWMHRLLHNKRIYKYTHAVHHRSTNPSPWTSYSFHILEAVAEGVVLVVLVFVIPMHVTSIALFTVIGLAINVYGHLGYEIAPKAFRSTFLFKLLNTSVHHNLHHSRFKGNYGLYFRFWDRLMKTEVPDYEDQYDQLQQKRFGS